MANCYRAIIEINLSTSREFSMYRNLLFLQNNSYSKSRVMNCNNALGCKLFNSSNRSGGRRAIDKFVGRYDAGFDTSTSSVQVSDHFAQPAEAV